MDNTSAGADHGGGTAGLLGFSQKMTQSDENFSVADVRKILPIYIARSTVPVSKQQAPAWPARVVAVR